MYKTRALSKKELALGNLTTTKNTPSLISGATAPYLKWQYQLVNKAPGLPAVVGSGLSADGLELDPHSAVANYFDNLNQSQFVGAMYEKLPASPSIVGFEEVDNNMTMLTEERGLAKSMSSGRLQRRECGRR